MGSTVHRNPADALDHALAIGQKADDDATFAVVFSIPSAVFCVLPLEVAERIKLAGGADIVATVTFDEWQATSEEWQSIIESGWDAR